MSSLKASVTPPRLAGTLTRSLYALGFSLAVSTLATQSHAACQYVVGGEWSNGFTASVKITNDTTTAVNGWTLNWQYAGDSRISGSYDVTMSGTNPYTAKNAGWNGTIQPNQTVTFGFQGSKGSGAAEVPALTGTLCGTTAASSSVAVSSSSRSSTPSSIAPSSSSRSSTPSSIAPSSSSRSSTPSSIASSVASSSVAAGGYSLNVSESYLNFVTTKNTHVVEAHNFISLGGEINAAGIATLTIDLNTVNTGVSLRDQRMRDLLFEVATYPTATVTVNVPAS
jgi:polyisoprenoid-binding protein YceI